MKMKHFGPWLIVTALFLTGCWSNKLQTWNPGDGVFEVPIESKSDFPPVTAGNGTVFDAPKGDEPAAILDITVPASTTPTRVRINKKKTTLFEQAMTNKPKYAVETNKKDVDVAQPKKSLWWRWLVLVGGALLLIVAIFFAIAQRVISFSPWTLFLRIFKR